MAKAKKFGTFAGVFTPSLLTILGVIMYMRLGWVVGESGLVATLAIIFIAHIISVTTGLSVSSVATDKKVKAGGLYYMLSRSLGLPIGGAIGITLFVGTALSISMYIVGFSDSFNNAIGFAGNGLMNTRITGTITLTLITIVALISTSVALKAQYYIMAAIFLSLVSIVVGGVWGNHGLEAAVPSFWPPTAGISLEVVFAIFFPAVTGFTAGVAMSGDLQDPKKSIPVGTMASILVGLIVYVGLACFLAFFVDRAALREDYNVLSRITYFSAYGAPLLMAGIWGATLSSALGGILGGPRILQAMSFDRVTPPFFGKGVGKSNEPRRALIFTFLIAEMGILIGELDLIAPIVSMFYLSAYGFINLTSALESWSGSDFRPQFKIPRAVSVLGAIATFVVMFRLNFVAMLASFLIIGLIFLYLTRKQISIGFSDIWQGVWSEVLRTSLFMVNRKQTDQRNWRPNILLFSGDQEKRRYMLEFGQNIVSRLGVVSSFELKEDSNVSGLMPVPDAVDTSDSKSFFNRTFLCDDVYEGIGTIAATYGFSGVSPNTVMLGWSRYTGAPYKFTKLLHRFAEIDYNVLVMDYDREFGFRNKDRIDIWFRGKGRNLSFALTMARFLLTGDDWRNAHVRILTDLEKSEVNSAEVYKSMEVALETLRLNAEVKIVSSAQQNRSFLETLKAESAQSSLVMLGLPDIEPGKEQEFYERTDLLCDRLGTVLLYRASSHFHEIDLHIPDPREVATVESETSLPVDDLEILIPPSFTEMVAPIETAHRAFEETFNHYFKTYFTNVIAKDLGVFKTVAESIRSLQQRLLTEKPELDEVKLLIIQFLEQNAGLLQNYVNQEVAAQQALLEKGGKEMRTMAKGVFQYVPPRLKTTVLFESLSDERAKLFKDYLGRYAWGIAKISSKQFIYRVPFRKMIYQALNYFGQDVLIPWLWQNMHEGEQIQVSLQKVIAKIYKAALKTDKGNEPTESYSSEALAAQIDEILADLLQHETAYQQQLHKQRKAFLGRIKEYVQLIADTIEQVEIHSFLRRTHTKHKERKLRRAQLEEFPLQWQEQRTLYLNFLQLDFHLKAFQLEFEAYFQEVQKEITEDLQNRLLVTTRSLSSFLQKLEEELLESGTLSADEDTWADFQNIEYNDWLFGIDETVEANLGAILSHFPNTILLEVETEEETNEVESVSINPSEIVKYVLQDVFIGPFSRHLNELNGYVGFIQASLRDVVRIISFSVDNFNAPKVLQSKESKAETLALLQKEIAHLDEMFQELTEKKHHFLERVNYHLYDTFDKLEPYFIIKSAANLEGYKRTKGRLRFISGIQAQFDRYRVRTQRLLVRLQYSKTMGQRFAQKMQKALPEMSLHAEQMAKGVQQILPSEQALQALPLYYRQLFLRERNTSAELWYETPKLRAEIDDVLSRYRLHPNGGVLITGEAGSGKTFLAQQIGKKYLKNENEGFYIINPPYRGSVNPRVFKSSLARATGFSGGLEAVFSKLPAQSVILFDDLELWWERSTEGMAVLEQIEEMINRYSSQVLFIFTMNVYTFRFISQYKDLASLFFTTVQTGSFSAKELQEIIMFRHESSRVTFSMGKHHENEISQYKLACLFNHCYSLSEGNVGVALQTWISAIDTVSDSEVSIIKQPKISTEIFAHIQPHLIIILLQIILHKRITAPKLARLLGVEGSQISNAIHTLKRYRLLEEQNGVLWVNRFVRPYLVKSFIGSDILPNTH